MLEILGTVFGASAGGGLLGLIGGLFRQWLDGQQRAQDLSVELQTLKEKNRHESDMRDKDLALMQAEAASQFKLEEMKGDNAIEAARFAAIGAMQAADKATFATGDTAANSPWFIAVDCVRGLIRPVITILFDLAMLVIFGVLVALLWDSLQALFAAKDPMIVKPMFDLLFEVVKSIIFLATTATGYWFVARSPSNR